MRTSLAKPAAGRTPALIGAGLIWLARAVMGLYAPDYWSPRTPFDYAAVVGTSLGCLLLALGLWGWYQQNPAPPGRAQVVGRAGVVIAGGSALTLGVSNFVEDALGVRGLGPVWVIGILALTAGLIVAGLAILWVKEISRWAGVWLLIGAAGLLFIESYGLFGLGLALLALSSLKGARS